MIYECKVCGYRYDESKESVKFASLPSDWVCPVCGVGKDMFAAVEDASVKDTAASSAVQADSSGLKTASDVLAQTMANWGVRWVLGMVGHSNLGMAEAIRRCVDAGKMRYIGIRHEGAAAFACSAYGKLTAKPAACITIAGPGATNLITGLADAHLDRAPVIALTGQVPSKDMGLYAFQEIDLLSAFKEVAGSRQILQSGSDFGELMTTACRSAIANGDVSQIALPDDMQVLDANGSLPSKPDGALFSPPVLPPDSEISKAASMICAASRPVIIMGNGCRAAIGWVMELAEKLNCPVMTTYRAKGFVADSHPLACGVVGRSGTPVSAKFMSESDLIIGLGMGFSRHSEISKNKKILQIDRDPRAIGRLRRVDFGLVGDMAASLEKIVGQIYYAQSINMRGEIAAQWAAWREEKSRRAAKSLPGAISQAAVCAALSKYVEPTAIVSVDVGNVAYAFGRYFECKNQRMLLSWYLGSIGVGLPAAMGAWCATREPGQYEGRQVVAVVGDGGIGQYLAEWTTVVKNNMDIKCVVFNNSELAKISLEQQKAKMDVWQTSLLNPSFAEFSKLCGGEGVRIDNPEKLDGQLSEALKKDGPVMIEIMTNPEI